MSASESSPPKILDTSPEMGISNLRKQGLAELPTRARMFSAAVGEMFDEPSGVATLQACADDVQAIADSITDKLLARKRHEQSTDADHLWTIKARFKKDAEGLRALAAAVAELEGITDSPIPPELIEKRSGKNKPGRKFTKESTSGALTKKITDYLDTHKYRLQKLATGVIVGTRAIQDLQYWTESSYSFGDTAVLRAHVEQDKDVMHKFAGLKGDEKKEEDNIVEKIFEHLVSSGLPHAADNNFELARLHKKPPRKIDRTPRMGRTAATDIAR